MPKLVIYIFVTRQVAYPRAKMGTFFCTAGTQGQIAQILLLHVTKAGPDWAFTPRSSKNTKRMLISI